MKIIFAEVSDAPIIHQLMVQAFNEYKNKVPPTSALNETVESITEALIDGEHALISYMDDEPVGMVRFRVTNEGVYFFRLSITPEKQGQGIAKQLLKSLENHAIQRNHPALLCKVRMDVPKNIQLYQSIGFTIYDEYAIHKPNGITINVVAMKKVL
ncbi:GNAT family N-acetyltransferase [Salipaludibacillus sp. HK11]|uniref:GNAT family N-acetyltransferase n=1 Tax=Salipaludibacillus sp. HK11 TaxID=3394320 RepID=UPI0039FD0F01